jgi:hypothetical protein
MKSSTTFIQKILADNRNLLLKQGIYYPGKRSNQQFACYGIAGKNIPWIKDKKKFKIYADALLDEIEEYRKNFDILISAEALSSMTEDGAEKFLSAIGGADIAILSLRNLYKTLPSAWQQTLKKGNSESILRFFKRLDSTRAGKFGLWQTYSYSQSAKVWHKFLKVKCFMLPNHTRDHGEPWKMFSSCLNLSDSHLFLIPEDKSNSSFSMEDANILRSIAITASTREMSPKDYCLRYYNKFILSKRNSGTKILPPIEYKSQIQEWNNEEWHGLTNLDIKIVGIKNGPGCCKDWLTDADQFENPSHSDFQIASDYLFS